MKVLSREETKAIFKPENIIGQLVNADAGWNRLFDVPHRKFLRMYIVYHLNVSSIRQDSKRLDTIVINNDLMRRMNMTEDDLYSAAVKLYSNMNMNEIQLWANEVSHMLKDETEFITTDIYIYRSKSHIIESVPGGQEWQL